MAFHFLLFPPSVGDGERVREKEIVKALEECDHDQAKGQWFLFLFYQSSWWILKNPNSSQTRLGFESKKPCQS